MNVPVVHVQARGVQARQRRQQSIELHRAFPRRDAGAVHAAVEIEEQVQRDVGLDRRVGQRADRGLVVHDCRKLRPGERLHEAHEPFHVRPDRLIREQHVGRPGRRRHLRFGNRGALEPGNASIQMHPHHFAQLVGLHVRPQPLDAARDLDHAADVLVDTVGVDEEGWGRDVSYVVDGVPGHGGRLHQLPTTKSQLPRAVAQQWGENRTNQLVGSTFIPLFERFRWELGVVSWELTGSDPENVVLIRV